MSVMAWFLVHVLRLLFCLSGVVFHEVLYPRRILSLLLLLWTGNWIMIFFSSLVFYLWKLILTSIYEYLDDTKYSFISGRFVLVCMMTDFQYSEESSEFSRMVSWKFHFLVTRCFRISVWNVVSFHLENVAFMQPVIIFAFFYQSFFSCSVFK